MCVRCVQFQILCTKSVRVQYFPLSLSLSGGAPAGPSARRSPGRSLLAPGARGARRRRGAAPAAGARPAPRAPGLPRDAHRDRGHPEPARTQEEEVRQGGVARQEADAVVTGVAGATWCVTGADAAGAAYCTCVTSIGAPYCIMGMAFAGAPCCVTGGDATDAPWCVTGGNATGAPYCIISVSYTGAILSVADIKDGDAETGRAHHTHASGHMSWTPRVTQLV